ncbi:cation transporter, partial [Streptomyces sp. NPDC058301]|uniref:cation transporter n=1 Tax=Streptomyces sp. NPDC058301 TaxID=3346436 RepID=UPI0036E0ABFA
MTCASCAARIEKKLNRMDGVEATVNYATEKAKVAFGDGVEVAGLVATVVKMGYTAQSLAPRTPAPASPPAAAPRAPSTAALVGGDGNGADAPRPDGDARGHAVEARLYAEDPSRDWTPQTGTLHRFSVPPSVRLDTG